MADSKRKILMKKGMVLPVVYDKKVVFIRDDKPFEPEEAKLPYESKIHIDRAIKAGDAQDLNKGDKK